MSAAGKYLGKRGVDVGRGFDGGELQQQQRGSTARAATTSAGEDALLARLCAKLGFKTIPEMKGFFMAQMNHQGGLTFAEDIGNIFKDIAAEANVEDFMCLFLAIALRGYFNGHHSPIGSRAQSVVQQPAVDPLSQASSEDSPSQGASKKMKIRPSNFANCLKKPPGKHENLKTKVLTCIDKGFNDGIRIPWVVEVPASLLPHLYNSSGASLRRETTEDDELLPSKMKELDCILYIQPTFWFIKACCYHQLLAIITEVYEEEVENGVGTSNMKKNYFKNAWALIEKWASGRRGLSIQYAEYLRTEKGYDELPVAASFKQKPGRKPGPAASPQLENEVRRTKIRNAQKKEALDLVCFNDFDPVPHCLDEQPDEEVVDSL